MKNAIMLLILGMGLIANASGHENFGTGLKQYNPQAIYKALKVQEVFVNPGIVGSRKSVKSIGGLNCTREEAIVLNPIPTYYCEIDQTLQNFEAIYNSLKKVKENVLNPGAVGVRQTEKFVGGLLCTRELIVVPNAIPTYNCQILE